MGSMERRDIRQQLSSDRSEFQVLADLLERRFSCRAFLPEPVPRETVQQMLTLAQMTASWANTQPWQITVTSGAATDRLREVLLNDYDHNQPFLPSDYAFPETYTGARLDRRREVGWQLYEAAGVTKGDREGSARQARENQRLFGAPHAFVIHAKREMGTYGAVDCGIFLGNLLLGAEALGIGMIAQAALAQHCGTIRKFFGLPDDDFLVVGGSFGFADKDNPVNQFRSRRAPQEETVKWVDA